MSQVISVSRSPIHGFTKDVVDGIDLIPNHGVLGDCHAGPLVQHLYRVRKDPTAPNLCQVHLLQSELFDDLRPAGFHLVPGQIGENITTRGIDLLTLPVGARLHLGPTAIVQITGLREPCSQLNRLSPGLMKACITRVDGSLVRKAGVMGIVLEGGKVAPDDPIEVVLPKGVWIKMGPV